MHAVDDDRYEWWNNEPGRLEADQLQMQRHFPELIWSTENNGQWRGALPAWPFSREAPSGLDALLNGYGLEVLVLCGQAYPAAPPKVLPLNPEPEIVERTQQRWHVNGDGSLCLFQSESVWNTRATLVDVLLKAAGWNVEYALMKAGFVEAMTINGIVTDIALDTVISQSSRHRGAW